MELGSEMMTKSGIHVCFSRTTAEARSDIILNHRERLHGEKMIGEESGSVAIVVPGALPTAVRVGRIRD